MDEITPELLQLSSSEGLYGETSLSKPGLCGDTLLLIIIEGFLNSSSIIKWFYEKIIFGY